MKDLIITRFEPDRDKRVSGGFNGLRISGVPTRGHLSDPILTSLINNHFSHSLAGWLKSMNMRVHAVYVINGSKQDL